MIKRISEIIGGIGVIAVAVYAVLPQLAPAYNALVGCKRVIKVDAREDSYFNRWKSAGVRVRGGDEIRVDATGFAWIDDSNKDASRVDPSGGKFTCSEYAPSHEFASKGDQIKCGALVGRIGDVQFIPGSSYEAAVVSGGELQFTFRDFDASNNLGGFEVNVYVKYDSEVKNNRYRFGC